MVRGSMKSLRYFRVEYDQRKDNYFFADGIRVPMRSASDVARAFLHLHGYPVDNVLRRKRCRAQS